MSAPRKSTAQPQNAKRRVQPPYSQAEWDALPVILDTLQTARATNHCARWVTDHGTEIGGRKVGGRWTFAKAQVARYLGISE